MLRLRAVRQRLNVTARLLALLVNILSGPIGAPMHKFLTLKVSLTNISFFSPTI